MMSSLLEIANKMQAQRTSNSPNDMVAGFLLYQAVRNLAGDDRLDELTRAALQAIYTDYGALTGRWRR